MDATPPSEKTVHDLCCDLKTLRLHIDGHFIEQHAHIDAQLFATREKLNARMDSQTYMIIGMLLAVFLALVAVVAAS